MAKIAIDITNGTLQQDDIVVGIDLGTTNSLVAAIHTGTKKPIVLKNEYETATVPSIIHFSNENKIIVGNDAKQYLIASPLNTIFSIKRLFGKNYDDFKNSVANFTYKIFDNDDDKLVKIKVDNKFYSPIELSSFILKELKSRAEKVLKTNVHKAVITVPAYFNDSQRQATRDAGKLAGLDVLRIVNEPTAASLAYGLGLQKNESKTIAVYDLGGGTFDISILKIEDGVFEVLSTNGNTYLGGDDFDAKIISFFLQQTEIKLEDYLQNKNWIQAFRLKAEEAKIYLSNHPTFESSIDNHKLNITLNDFEVLIADLVNDTLQCCQKAINDAAIDLDQIDEILMVGGSTRIPFVKKSVSNFFKKNVNDSINPDEVVALGAAIQADVLAGNNKDVLLLDITPLSLGIETMGGLMDVIIPRNSKIPTSAGRQYTTHVDGQANMKISVYQGERDLVSDNRKLAAFELKGIPSMPAGLPKVEINFRLNADGILKVQATELRSGVQQTIDVQPQYGLTDQEVEQLLLDSIKNAQADVATRAIIEATTEAEQLIFATNNFLQKHKTFISEDEQLQTNEAIVNLQESINSQNKNNIQKNIEILNQISKPFAERVMDAAVQNALKGKNVF